MGNLNVIIVFSPGRQTQNHRNGISIPVEKRTENGVCGKWRIKSICIFKLICIFKPGILASSSEFHS